MGKSVIKMGVSISKERDKLLMEGAEKLISNTAEAGRDYEYLIDLVTEEIEALETGKNGKTPEADVPTVIRDLKKVRSMIKTYRLKMECEMPGVPNAAGVIPVMLEQKITEEDRHRYNYAWVRVRALLYGKYQYNQITGEVLWPEDEGYYERYWPPNKE